MLKLVLAKMLLGIASKLVATTVVLGGVLFINCCNNQLVVTNECHDLCKKVTLCAVENNNIIVELNS